MSREQQKRLNAMAGDMADQVLWRVDGVLRKMSKDDWRHFICGHVRRQPMAEGIDGGLVILAVSSRDFSKQEAQAAIDLLQHLGDSRQVRWGDPKFQEYERWAA